MTHLRDATISGELTNDAIARRFQQHRSEISHCINPNELFSCMCEDGLAEMELMGIINNQNESRETKVQAILNAVESSSKPNTFVRFASCVKKEQEHLGHSYIAKLLSGEEISASLWADMKASARYKGQCMQGRKTLMSTFNVEDLLPTLYAKRLLTLDECERLTNPAMPMTRQDKVSFIISLLEAKGPTAYLLFVKCLEETCENPSHEELLQQFTGIKRVKKRKHTEQSQTLCSVTSKLPKFIPRQTKAHGIIVSQTYLEAVEKIHELQYKGDCRTAILEVEAYKSAGEVELYVALMCRNWYAYVNCHKSPQEVDSMVDDAIESLQTVDDDNRAILESRCEWMLSKYYWYMKDKEKAKHHIDESMLIQASYQVAPGEDTLLTHYGKACTLLDTLAEQWTRRAAKQARRLIENANDFAQNCDNHYGLYLSHHCIRLAQISLRSSPQCPGVCNNPSDLKEAASTLNSVIVNTLSPRTKCLFYITYSDYYRNMVNHREALNYAQKAHSIAETSGFDTELESIEKRFSVLAVGETFTQIENSYTMTSHEKERDS